MPRTPQPFVGASVAVGLVAMIGRLPALGAWWNQDDWGLLARAARLAPGPDVPVRWLTQTAYWQLLWPVAGLDPAAYAATRIAIHALSAAGVVRLAGQLGLSGLQQWTAGLIMAATPLAFTSLYWAAGIQDLVAVALAVWALERWLAGGRGATLAAVVLAVAAAAAKETVAGLPLVMLVASWAAGQEPLRTPRTLLLLAPAAASLVAVVLALQHFATGAGQPYALGSAGLALGSLATYGWWLLLPGPEFPPQPAPWQLAGGALLWAAWPVWAVWHLRRGRRDPAFALAGAAVMLAPLLALARHLAPDLAYPVEPFGAVALAGLLRPRWRPRPALLVALALLAVAWALLGMRGRLALREPGGLPADPVVRRTAASWAACRQLQQWPLPAGGLVIVQPPLTPQTAAMAEALGEDKVLGSLLYHSLDGYHGPRLVLGADVPIQWANGLRRTPAGAFVALDGGDRLRPWGPTGQALLYQTLTDVGCGLFERARLHLLRASLLIGPGGTFAFAYDDELLPVDLARVVANRDAFLAFLAQQPPDGVGSATALGLNFQRLLAACRDEQADPGETP